jgi:tRNA A-37 threonylcarbamoyl transferase component Bud32
MKSKIYPYRLKVGTATIAAEIPGGNSSVFKGYLSDGTALAIKEYKGDKQRIERMLSREEKAINFLRGHGMRDIPEILEVRDDLGLIVYRWIEGNAPLANHEAMSAIIKMNRDLADIHKSGGIFDNAIDAVFSVPEISNQILTRIQQFQVSYPIASVRVLCDQLNQRLRSCISSISQNSEFTQHTLSVSDLGTHNIISSGSVYNFIDFEFFGLDSIHKVVGDFLLHPRNEFKEAEILRFMESISKISNWDSIELNRVMPLLTLKWAVIAYGRTFREAKLEATGEITEEQIKNSNGSFYLSYFDSLKLTEGQDRFATFSSFKGSISQS